jgi:hypothetical protein
MANVLCVWEMGSSLGHLSNLKPVVQAAQAAGHRVSLAVKELQNVQTVLPGFDGPLYQAPFLSRPPRRFLKSDSWSQLLLTRFDCEQELDALYRAWDSIFLAADPQLVVYDHTAAALVASLHKPWRKWLIGSGFLLPRSDAPYLGVFPGVRDTPDNHAQLALAERDLLALVNAVLASRQLPALDDVRDLIRQADRQCLMTLPELDHLGTRPDTTYLGIPEALPGAQAQWPSGQLKVFCYLPDFDALEVVLAALMDHHAAVLLYGRDTPSALRERYPGISFSEEPLDMQATLASADLVISTAGHQTSAQTLLAGVAHLMVPRYREQLILAQRVAAMKRGVIVLPDAPAPQIERAVAMALELAAAGRQTVAPDLRAELSGPRLQQALAQMFSADLPGDAPQGI